MRGVANGNMSKLIDLFETTFEKNPDKIAIEYGDRKISCKNLQGEVRKWCKELTDGSAELKENTKVLLALDDDITFIFLWLALWKINCIPVPMDGFTDSEELIHAVDASSCNIIISTKDINLDNLSKDSKTKFTKVNCNIDNSITYIKTGYENIEENPNDCALLFYTSGTTGLPKCVCFSHDAMKENVLSLAEAIHLTSNDVFFTPLSIMLPATIASVFLPAFSVGSTLVMTKASFPGSIIKNVFEKNVTVFYAVPYMYSLLCTAMSLRKSEYWKNVRLCFTSSAFLDKDIFDSFYEKTSIPIRSLYCSSEGGAISFNRSDDLELLRNSVGYPLSGVIIRILNDTGEEVPPGVPGNIFVGGSHISFGYHNRETLNKEVFKDNKVNTGDLGYMDKSGYIFLTGRASETINVSGFLVNPEEVEEAIKGYPQVKDVLVYGFKSMNTGECVGAKIILKNDKDILDTDQLYEYLSKKLNHYKIPRHCEIVKELPQSRYGKKIRSRMG
ncbi:long-chain fatty acid--CoA ligase [Acetivibrio mesophilus]|uniref:Long-chain fatty acid--CoA ligase n=2 Tax=Acetivibrio mesophilus TaxID=2487273 RepID=A0A4Q0I8H8_9FIRM|nr:long-chain fatty acid--CoA ligase [Acetivibrio mesophilus]